MNLIYETLLYMSFVILFVKLLDKIFFHYDLMDYKAFNDKSRLMFMLMSITFGFFLYAISQPNPLLPFIIVLLSLCLLWLWIFIMDVDLKFYSLFEKIILLSITVIVLISLFYSIEYVLLIGVTKLLRIDLCDYSDCDCYSDDGKCYDQEGCVDKQEIYIKTDKTFDEVKLIVNQCVRKYDDDNDYHYNDMVEDITNAFGGIISPNKAIQVCEVDIHKS